MKWLFMGFVMIFFTACIPSTKELVVYEENIGLPSSFLGLYKNAKPGKNKIDNEIEKLELCYKNGKYYFAYVMIDDIGNIVCYTGIFLPSKVSNRNDYYIISIPSLKFINYDLKNKVKEKKIGTKPNLLLTLKKEKNTLRIWDVIESENISKISTDEVKKRIYKSYKYTFLKTPMITAKDMISCDKSDISGELDKKYKDFKLKIK